MSQQTLSQTPPTRETTPRLGLPPATALVIGSIIGVGIFNLPGSLASYGPISLVAMALTTVGALALAVMFATMSKRMPADGGPYAYARVAFGNLTGFSNAWLYWITAWAGNAAIVSLTFTRQELPGGEQFTASARIANRSGAALADREVTLDVDGHREDSRRVSAAPNGIVFSRLVVEAALPARGRGVAA